MTGMYEQLRGILARYGRTIAIRREGAELRVKAYVSPLTTQNRRYLEDKYSDIGYRDQNVFLYIGSPENGGNSLSVGDIVSDCGTGYLVSACEIVRLAEQPFYVWAMLRRANEGGSQ